MLPHSRVGRRTCLKSCAAIAAGALGSGWLGQVAASAVTDSSRKRSCILLWMAGGPSQLDTFDLKPGTENGGPIQEIQTATAGVKISEHLPLLAKQTQHLAIVRSMQTKEGDHGRAAAHLHTAYLPQASIRFPSLGALVSNEVAADHGDLPGFVSVGGSFAQPAVAAGFLGLRHAPLVVTSDGPGRRGSGDGGNLRVEDLTS